MKNGKRRDAAADGEIMKEEKHKEIWRMVKFTLFSASAGLIEIGTFTLLNELTAWSYWPCYLIALLASILWNFTLNRRFTFQSAANVPVAMLKVAAYYAVFTPLSTLGVRYLTQTCGWHAAFADALAMGTNLITEFLFQRFVVFGKSLERRLDQ